MANKDQVIALHKRFPKWTAPQIAARLRCDPGYIRATAKRQGLNLRKGIACLNDPEEYAKSLRARADKLLSMARKIELGNAQ